MSKDINISGKTPKEIFKEILDTSVLAPTQEESEEWEKEFDVMLMSFLEARELGLAANTETSQEIMNRRLTSLKSLISKVRQDALLSQKERLESEIDKELQEFDVDTAGGKQTMVLKEDLRSLIRSLK